VQLIRPPEKLIISEPAGIDIPELLAVLPFSGEVKRVAEEVRFAQLESVNVRGLGGEARSQNERDFVYGGDAKDHTARAVREREYVGVSEKRLSSENSLRLRAAQLGTPVTDLKSKEAADDGRLRRHVLLRHESSSSLPDSIAGDAKWRIRLDLDSGYHFPLARDGNPGETLTFRHGRTNRSDQ
jgi:hypothetical protein